MIRKRKQVSILHLLADSDEEAESNVHAHTLEVI
jgi:hypothetical protein